MSDAAQIVREFCELMVKRDAESLRPYLADDATYQNCGMPATVGVNDILANLKASAAELDGFTRELRMFIRDL